MLGKELFHIYGSFSINTYGVFIAIGLLLFSWLANRNPRRAALMSENQFSSMLLVGIIAGLIGGRTLYYIGNPQHITSIGQLFLLWEGGFSVLGCFISILAALSWYLKTQNIPVLPALDLVGLYAPLLQSISRLGCFFAGCCYGVVTTGAWAVTYTTQNTLAPCHIPLHPTQLYSSLLLFIVFITVHIIAHYKPRPGIIISAHVGLASVERFIVDFWRADREFIGGITILSLHQLTALVLAVLSFCLMITLLARQPES